MNEIKSKPGLLEAILNKRMLICIFHGFSSGLPLYFALQLIPYWLRKEGVDLKTIGFFSLLLLPYNWKFIWSPIMDRFKLPFLGRRRGWLLVTQIGVFVAMFSLSASDPQKNIWVAVWITFIVAFFSASQDIIIDAYRREILPDEELGLGNSMYMNFYRTAGYVSFSLPVLMSAYIEWKYVFIVTSLFMFVGILTTLFINEATLNNIQPPKTLRAAVIEPIKDLFQRDGVRSALLFLGFLIFYKLGDNMATALQTPFFHDVGFNEFEIGLVSKFVGVGATIVGSLLGGVLIFKFGLPKCLWMFGFVQMASIPGFAVLNEVGNNVVALGVVMGFEYIGVGLGATALAAFMAKKSNMSFTATQLALFTSIAALPRTLASSVSGVLVEGVTVEDEFFYNIFGEVAGMGFTHYFLLCTVFAIPGLFLLFWVAPWTKKGS